MPTYRVTNNANGVVLDLDGERPPTEQELVDIFAANSGSSPPDQQPTSAKRIAADVGIEAGGAMGGTIIGTALAPFTGGASIPIGAVVGGAIGGGIGNIIVQRGQVLRGERPDFSYGELLATVGLSAVPAGALGRVAIKSAATTAAALKAAGKPAAQTVAQTFGNKIATSAAEGALLAGGGEIIKNAIDQRRLPTANEFLTATVFGGALGAGIGTAERGVAKALSYTSEAILGNLVPIIKRVRGESAGLATEGEFAVKSLNSALGSIADKSEREKVQSQVMLYLKGSVNNTDELPENIVPQVKNVRNVIDGLSDLITKNGLVEKGTGLYNTIVSNDGAYIERAYRIFDGKWRPSTEVFQKFVKLETDNEIEKLINKRRLDREIREDLRIKNPKLEMRALQFTKEGVTAEIEKQYRAKLTQKYTDKANQLLDRDNAFASITGSLTARKTGLFEARQNLSPEFRELMGEINDPIYASSDTVSRMSNALATHSSLNEIKEAGLKSGLFRLTSLEGDVLLSKSSSSIQGLNPSPLADLYTTPLVREAFEAISTDQVSALAKKFGGFAAVSSALKIPLTLLSLKGYASNNWGAAIDVIGSGHGFELLDPANWKRSAKIAAYNLGSIKPDGSIDGKEAQNLYAKMRGAGLVSSNISFSDLMRGFQMSERPLIDKLPELAASKVKDVVQKLGKTYSTPELMSKVITLGGDLKDIKNAFPELSEDLAFKEAARRTRLATQDYDSLPRYVKDLSSVGGLGPFVAYSADRFRVVYNSFKIGIEDMASGNAVLMRSGARRVASMTAVLGTASYLGANIQLSPEEDKALRNRMPEWDRDSAVHIFKPDENGNFNYTNLNYNFPHVAAIEAMQAAIRGKDPEEAFTNFMSTIGRQAFGTNLLLAPLAEISAGKNRYGLPITSDNEPFYRQVFDKSKYFLDATIQPLAWSEAKKFYNALKSKDFKVQTSGGESYGIGQLVAENFGGVRYKTVNIAQRLKVGVSSMSRNLSEDNISFASQKKRSLSPEDTNEAYLQYEKRYGNTYSKALEFVNDSKVLGIEENEIVGIMKAGNLPSSLILGAVSGVYTPPALDNVNPATALYETVEKTPANQRQRKVEQLARENPTYARSLVNRYREDVRNEARDIDAVDKLILAQSELDGDRASFIFRKMQSLPDDTMRTLYLENLKNKGIVTIAVNSQLNQMFKAGGRTPETVTFPVSR